MNILLVAVFMMVTTTFLTYVFFRLQFENLSVKNIQFPESEECVGC